MEDVDTFYCHFVYFVDIWYSLFPFGMFWSFGRFFSLFGKLYQEKSGNPGGKVQCFDVNSQIYESRYGNHKNLTRIRLRVADPNIDSIQPRYIH
jgi:hypothetical protein